MSGKDLIKSRRLTLNTISRYRYIMPYFLYESHLRFLVSSSINTNTNFYFYIVFTSFSSFLQNVGQMSDVPDRVRPKNVYETLGHVPMSYLSVCIAGLLELESKPFVRFRSNFTGT